MLFESKNRVTPKKGERIIIGKPLRIQCAVVLARSIKGREWQEITICSSTPLSKSLWNKELSDKRTESIVITQIIPGAILINVSASGLIAIGNKEIEITKNIRGLRKLDVFLKAIFKSLIKVVKKIFKEKSL